MTTNRATVMTHRPARRRKTPSRTMILSVLGVVTIAGFAYAISSAIDDYRDRVVLKGLGGRPLPVNLIVAGEPMVIPANMIRFRPERRGGAMDRVDLLLQWPSLEGFSEERAEDFRDTSSDAPLIYVTLSARATDLDSTARLKSLYPRFFDGPAFDGPAELVWRKLSPESGYRNELLYYSEGPDSFVARCMARETPEMPATCIRDVNVGRGLSMLYRFNRSHIADWRMIDQGLKRLINVWLRKA
jgi:hypothetical protein